MGLPYGQNYRTTLAMREEVTRYILAASVVVISAAVSTAIARTERYAFVATTSEKVMLRPATQLGADVGSATLSGSAQPTATRGGTISVYGTEASPLNSSYGGDVHIFSGGNPTSGFGQVWLGVTVDDPELGVVPQDVIGLQNDRSIDMFSYGGLRVHASEDGSQVATIAEGEAGPAITLKSDTGEANITLFGDVLAVSAPIVLPAVQPDDSCKSGSLGMVGADVVACHRGRWRALFSD
jgi:hypothetical protein